MQSSICLLQARIKLRGLWQEGYPVKNLEHDWGGALEIQMSWHPVGFPVQMPPLAFLAPTKFQKMVGVSKKVIRYYPHRYSRTPVQKGGGKMQPEHSTMLCQC